MVISVNLSLFLDVTLKKLLRFFSQSYIFYPDPEFYRLGQIREEKDMQENEVPPQTSEETYKRFQDILSDAELQAIFDKYGVKDERERKLPVRCFFWLMVLSASQPAARGCILTLIGFFIGALASLFPSKEAITLSKNAVSKRLIGVSWYLFRGVYTHLLEKYRAIMRAKEVRFLHQFKDAFVIDGSVVKLCNRLESILKSVHKAKSSLKLNVKYSLKIETLTKLQVSEGKRNDSRFSSVTKCPNILYLFDLGYWSFILLKKVIDAGSFFVMRLKSSCDPLIIDVLQEDFKHLIGKRLSEIKDFLKAQTQLDLSVQLSKAKRPKFTSPIRLVGLLYEGQWRFYITNIFDPTFTAPLIYEVYAMRWQVEVFFNAIKNVLNLKNIIAKTKNGIMLEIYAALICYLLTRIVIALAAKKVGKSIHLFSFERTFKLVKGVLLANIQVFFRKSLDALDSLFQTLIDAVALMGLRQKIPKIMEVNQRLSP